MVTDDFPTRSTGRPTEPPDDLPLATSVSAAHVPRMPPTEVARRSFSTVRRGFDPEEVRSFLEHVGKQLEAAERREQELLHELTNAEERARHPVIDEGVLTSALGQRSAAILRAAHEEAARTTQQAEEAAAALVRETQQHATDAHLNAESSAAERIAEAELEANAVRQQAREEAAAVLEAARAEGESLLERAREHGRSMLDQAQEARRRVLADMAHRRRVVTDQIEQFRAARDEVAHSVLGVRRSLDQIVEELSRADESARLAASDAARPRRVDATEAVLVGEAERAAAEVGADSGALLAHLAATGEALALASDRPGGAGSRAGRSSSPSTPAAGAAEETADGDREAAPRVTLRFDDIATAVEPDPDITGVVVAVSESVTAATVPGGATDVEGLFARLRAEQGDEVGDPADVTVVEAGAGPVEERGATAEGAGEEGEPEPTGPAEEDAASSPEAEALAARAASIDPVVSTLSRKLKRALQDDQNRVLDRLRKGPGEWRDDLLGEETEQQALYEETAADAVRDCVAAGIAFGRSHAGRRLGRAPSPDARTVHKIAGELAATVVTLLRRRLEGEELPDPAERIGAAYREWRGERIERLAQDAAVDAFDAGVLVGAARSPGVRWVRSEDGPGCADCEDNALAGAVAPGEAFPTGHDHPPAHAGCRCLLLPTPT